MKKSIKSALCFVLTLVFSVCSFACTAPSIGGDVKIDEKRTQLYVFNYAAGYGTEWLANAIAEYERLHANDVYEEGKMGIQIVPTNMKRKREAAEILQNKEEVYFTESITQYYQMINEGAFADITSAVVETNVYEPDKTIESKLTAEQKSFYAHRNGENFSYYGIPHYSGAFGIIYDIDLFEQKGYYFKQNYNPSDPLEEHFIYYETDAKTAGPDGKTGIIEGVDYSVDDGLPVTYDEFLELLEYISSTNVTPLCWSGSQYAGYITLLYNQLVVNDAGIDEARLTYTMNGPTSKLGRVEASGEFVYDAVPTTITPDNAYELYRHDSKYYALDFLRSVVKTEKYLNETAFTNTHEHTTAQDDFLWSGKDNITKPMAMLADGVWWQAEATETFRAMETQLASWGKKGRNFGWMPLPRATAKDQKNVFFDTLYSMSFVKKNIASWKLPIALDFIQFMHTDASLKQFTIDTNTPKALNYTMSEEELEKLSPFGRSVVDYRQRADVLYPLSNETKFLNNQAIFSAGEGFKSRLDVDQTNPPMTFHESSATAKAYFDGMYVYWQDRWSTLN